MTTRLVTVKELLEAPTGFDWATIAEDVTTSDPEQAIEQANVIDRASRWVANFVRQPSGLQSTTDSETARIGSSMAKAWIDRDGLLWFKTDLFPILSVTSMQWAIAGPGQGSLVWNAFTVANLQLYGEGFRISRIFDLTQDWSFLRRSGAMIQLTYVNGWPNAVLSAVAPAPGSNVTLTVDSSLGMTATPAAIGNQLTIYDGAQTEIVTVTAVPSATSVTVASTVNNHAKGVGISAIPSDVKEATILACTFFAKQRGTEAWEMGAGGGGQGPGVKAGPRDEGLVAAEMLLDEYRRYV